MKTRIYLSTLLAISIQVMVIGQTQENQASDSRSQNKLGVVLKHHTSSVAATETHQSKIVVTKNNIVVKTVQSSNTILSPKQKADDLILKSNDLKAAAQNSKGLVKNELIAEANDLYKQAEMIMINSLEESSKKNKETYTLNKTNLNQLLEKTNVSAMAAKEAQNFISDANLNMRLANEMIQEAYAMPTNAGKLGSMSNANDKEILALGDQNQAIHILKTYAANAAAGIDFSSYAAK